MSKLTDFSMHASFLLGVIALILIVVNIATCKVPYLNNTCKPYSYENITIFSSCDNNECNIYGNYMFKNILQTCIVRDIKYENYNNKTLIEAYINKNLNICSENIKDIYNVSNSTIIGQFVLFFLLLSVILWSLHIFRFIFKNKILIRNTLKMKKIHFIKKK